MTLRGRWLGQRLRELRDASGQTIEEVAEYLQRSMGTVSRFETGVYPIRRTEVTALLGLYRVNDPKERASLLRIADDVWRTGWWDGYSNDVEDWFIDFVWLEELAVEHRLFENTVVPGLFQTSDYARAVMHAAQPDAADERIDRWIELRLARQKLLDREHPPTVKTVVDESVLHRRVGSARIMRAQLDALLGAAERPGVELRVLPYSAGAHASPHGAFSVYEMADPYPEVGYVETPRGALYVESPDSAAMLEMYDRLWAASLPPKESTESIRSIIEELA
ncbi:helix-turn-helix transcriptional regulator [Nocardiopsis rhodophaea]|uniref:helix-turn-helix domain-containing protein n=1 Tax=Nocardiopsis rhodophaea TaxID=280238 RepID=UPI0031D0206C